MNAQFGRNGQIINSILSENELTELFKDLTLQKLQSQHDFSIERVLSNATASEDDLLSYAILLINTVDKIQQRTGACIIHHLLADSINPPICKVMHSSIVPYLIQLIPGNDEAFALEVLSIITNITLGDQKCAAYVISIRSIELFNILLNTNSWDIFHQIMGAIGNITESALMHRDLILNQINFKPIICCMSEIDYSSQSLATVLGSISKLIRTRPVPSFDKIKDFCPFLSKVLISSNDYQVLQHTLESCTSITNEQIPLDFLSENVLLKVISLFNSDFINISIPALKVFGNYTTEKVNQEFIERSEVLYKLVKMIDNPIKAIRREVYGIISNLFTENSKIIQVAIEAGFFERFKETLNSDSKKIKREAIWAVNNLSTVCTFFQAKGIVANEILDIMIPYLASESDTADVILEGLDNFLKFDQLLSINKINMYLETILNLQGHIAATPTKLSKVIDQLKILSANFN